MGIASQRLGNHLFGIIVAVITMTVVGYASFNTMNQPVRNHASVTPPPPPLPATAPVVIPPAAAAPKIITPPAAQPVPSSKKEKILYTVPFLPQAPFGEWSDPHQQDGCEEASSIMAVLWAQGKTTNYKEGKKEILAIAQYEDETFGNYHDTSAEDTLSRIIKGYLRHTNARVQTDISTDNIKDGLYKGNLVILPMNGQKLGNPNFTAPGPERHMLVVIGYDPTTDKFITNDPGTRQGKGYRYTSKVIAGALRNYLTGYHEPITKPQTAMIVVSR